MIEKLERYIERKGLELNRKKTKIMRFRKREVEAIKTGDGRIIVREEVKMFKNLGYTLQRKGGMYIAKERRSV